MVRITESAAGRGPSGRRCRRARVAPVLAATLLAVAAAVCGGARDAAAGWLEGYAAPSPLVTHARRSTNPLTGLPEPGSGLLLPRSLAPRLAAGLVPPLLSSGAESYGAAVTLAADVASPIVSGLPWRSGAACSDATFEAWRGRRMDVNVTFAPHDSWQGLYDFLAAPWYRVVAQRTPQLVASLALLPRSHKGQHAACAAGAFDGNFQYMGQLLSQAGAGAAIVRLGWEANVGSDSHPWGIDTVAEAPAYIGCFQRAVTALRSTAPGIKIEWTNAQRGSLPFSVLSTYPGGDYVDLFGIHYYDSDPSMPTQTLWDERLYATTRYGGPHGIAQWVNTATAYGKKLAVSEWGVRKSARTPQADNALYIDNMYRFLRANAGSIAYESYFNCKEREHKIQPVQHFPQASARYLSLWSAGL